MASNQTDEEVEGLSPINLEQVPSSTQGFASTLLDRVSSPVFDTLNFEDKVADLSRVYNGKKWDAGSYSIFKQTMDDIWDGAKQDELPDIAEIAGPPPLTKKDPQKETAQWKENVIQGLVTKGVTPAVFGTRLDRYLDTASQDEIEAFQIRNRSTAGAIVSNVGNTAREVAKGAVSGISSPIAGIARLSGYEDTANTVEKLPELLGKSPNDYLYDTDENGYIKFNDDGSPITRIQAQAAQVVGQVGSFLVGGAALKVAGAGALAIEGGLFGANALTVGNDIYKNVYEQTGDRDKALTASLYALPAATVGSLGQLSVISKLANPVVNSLSNYNKVKYLSNVFSRNAAIGAVSTAGMDAVQQAGEISQTGQEFSNERLASQAIGGGLVSGVVGAALSKPRIDSRTTKLNDIPGPGEPPAPPSAEGVKVLEEFQKSQGQQLVLEQQEASKVSPEMLKLFQVDVTPGQEGAILTKKSSYVPQAETEDLQILNKQISTLSRDLVSSGTPDNAFGLTDKLIRLKKQYAEQTSSIGRVTEKTIKQRITLDNEIKARRNVLDEQTDPTLIKDAYAKLQDAKANLDAFDAADEGIYDLPGRIGDLQNEIEATQARLDNVKSDLFPNNLMAKQADLSRLVDKRKAILKTLKEEEIAAQKQPTKEGVAPVKPKPEPSLEKVAADQVEETDHTGGIPVSGGYVLPINGKWTKFKVNGEVASTGHSYFVDAVRPVEAVVNKVAEELPSVEAIDQYNANQKRIVEKLTKLANEKFQIEDALKNPKASPEELQSLQKKLQEVDAKLSGKQKTSEGSTAGAQFTKETKTGERIRKSDVLDKLTTDAFGDEDGGLSRYVPKSQKTTSEDAAKFISEAGGIPNAIKEVLTNHAEYPSRVITRATQDIISNLNESITLARQTGDIKAAESLAELQIKTADFRAQFLTDLGQGIEAARTWALIDPDSMILETKRRLREAAKEKLAQERKVKVDELEKKYPDELKKVLKDADGTLTPKIQAEIKVNLDAAKKVGGTAQQDLLAEVFRTVDNLNPDPTKDTPGWLFPLWQANQLSDPSTQVVNILGNTSQLVGSLSSFLATGIPRGKVDGFSMLKGFINGATKEGWAAAMLELQGIKTYKPLATKLEAEGLVPTRLRPDFVKDAPKWMKKIGLNNMGYVFRALSGADAFFYKTAQEGMARLAAYNVAQKQGLTGVDLKNRISELLHNSTKEWNEAAILAKQEMQVLLDAGKKIPKGLERTRTWEILEARRPEDIRGESFNFASKNTFNNKPEGVVGSVVESVNKLANTPVNIPGVTRPVRPFKYLFPFMNVAGNIANASLDYTPVGGYRAAFDGNLSSLERRNALGKFLIGSTLAGTIYGLAKEFEDDKDPKFAIYGSGPADPQQNKLWRDQGGRPYSIKVGDKYIRYSESPLGILLGGLGAIADKERYDKSFSRADLPEAIGIALSGVAKSFTDNSFLKSIGTVVDVITGQKDAQLLDALVTNPVKGFIPAAGTLRAISKLTEDPIDTKNNFYAKIVSGVPFVSKIGTKPALNAFGEPVERSFEDRLSFIGRFYSERVNDPAWRWLAETGYQLPNTGTTVGGNSFFKSKRAEDLGAAFADVLTLQERYKLVQESGPLIKKRVEQYAATYGNRPFSEDVQEQLKKDIEKIRSQVKKRLVTGALSED